MEHFVNVRQAVVFRPEKMSKTNLFESPRMFCDVYGFEPGQAQSAHVHEGADKVYYVLEGQGLFRVDQVEQTVGAGCAIFVPAGSSHEVRNLGPAQLIVLVVMAPPPGS